jgi:hypothetical protein
MIIKTAELPAPIIGANHHESTGSTSILIILAMIFIFDEIVNFNFFDLILNLIDLILNWILYDDNNSGQQQLQHTNKFKKDLSKLVFDGFNHMTFLIREQGNMMKDEISINKSDGNIQISLENLLDRNNLDTLSIGSYYYFDANNDLDQLKINIMCLWAKLFSKIPGIETTIDLQLINNKGPRMQAYIADLLEIIKIIYEYEFSAKPNIKINNWPSELIGDVPLFKFDGFGHIQNKDNKISVVRMGGASYEININPDNLQEIRKNPKNYHYFNHKVDDDQLTINLEDIIKRTGDIIPVNNNKSLDDINRMGEYNQKLISDFLKIIEAIEPIIKPFEITKDIVKPGFTFSGFGHMENSNTTGFQKNKAILIRINYETILTIKLDDLKNEKNKQKIFKKGKNNYYNLIHCDDPAQMNITTIFICVLEIINNSNNSLDIDKITKQSYRSQEIIYDFLKMVEVIYDDSHQFIQR